MTTNDFYQGLVEQLTLDKDANFEPCKVLEFDNKTLQAKVLGIRTKETKENVIVLFPSFYMGTGIITFPVPGSFGTTFVGPENSNYMVPGQYYLPTKKAVNNIAVSDASPGQFDFLLKLENIEPGEALIRSLNHAQIFVGNSGEIELLTKKLYRLSLNDIDGSLEMVVERERKNMGYSTWYNGQHETDEPYSLSEHHMYSEIYDGTPEFHKDEISLHDAKRLNVENVSMKDELQTPTKDGPKVTEQQINVYYKNPSGEFSAKKIHSDVDDTPLFHLKQLFGTEFGDPSRNRKLRWEFAHSSEGAMKILRRVEEKQEGYEITLDYDRIETLIGDPYQTAKTTLRKDYFRGLFKGGGLQCDVAAMPSVFQAISSVGGGLPQSYIMVTPSMGELAHITSSGKKIAVTVSGDGVSTGRMAARSMAAQSFAKTSGANFKISFDGGSIGLNENFVGIEKNGSKIAVSEEVIEIEKNDGSKIEVNDKDVLINGKSFNDLVNLVNKLAELNGLEDRI